MSIEIRTATEPEEIALLMRPIMVGFGTEPNEEQVERFASLIDPTRAHLAYENGEHAGSVGAFTFDLTVPGGSVPAAGVTVVGTLPTHRRRGVLTALMRAQLDDVRRRGEPVAILWSSEERIYPRFGYGMASLSAGIELDTAHAGFRDDPGPSGRFRLLDEAEALEFLPGVYDRVRAETPGMFARSDTWWSLRRLVNPPWRPATTLFRVVLELDGRPEGYALYRIEMVWNDGPRSTVEVEEAIGTSIEATREVWRYLCALDLVTRLRMNRLPVDHPLVLLLAEPNHLHLRLLDGLWCRIVDVESALAARSLGEGEVVLEVADAFLPENAGRYRVAAGGVGRTETEPDLALGVADLGSVYLGGFTFADLARAGRVSELREGAVARADAVLPAVRKPWCPESF